jgi:hypothetical protein
MAALRMWRCRHKDHIHKCEVTRDDSGLQYGECCMQVLLWNDADYAVNAFIRQNVDVTASILDESKLPWSMGI